MVYEITNECTEAIVAGLDLKSYDKVITICGSGDQAFAILNYVDSITAVDMKENQVDYANKRLERLKNGRRGFSNGYYHTPRDLERLRSRLGKIEIVKANIKDVDFSSFNKAYLSNAISYGECEKTLTLYKILSEMPSDSVVYFADEIRYYISNANRKSCKNKFYFETNLTEKARKKEYRCLCKGDWSPYVYRILPKGIEFVR